METNTFIIEADGKETVCTIRFTFENEGNSYVVFEIEGDDEDIYCAKYDEEGNIDLELTQEEFDNCLEVYGAFEDEEEA